MKVFLALMFISVIPLWLPVLADLFRKALTDNGTDSDNDFKNSATDMTRENILDACERHGRLYDMAHQINFKHTVNTARDFMVEFTEIYNKRSTLYLTQKQIRGVLSMIELCSDINTRWRQIGERMATRRQIGQEDIQTINTWARDLEMRHFETVPVRRILEEYNKKLKLEKREFKILSAVSIEKCERLEKSLSPMGKIMEKNINELIHIYNNAIDVGEKKVCREAHEQLNRIDAFLNAQLATLKVNNTREQMEEWLKINERYLDSALDDYNI